MEGGEVHLITVKANTLILNPMVYRLPYSFPLVLTAPTTPTLQNFNCFKFSWGRFVLLLKKEEKKHVKTDRQYISSWLSYYRNRLQNHAFWDLWTRESILVRAKPDSWVLMQRSVLQKKSRYFGLEPVYHNLHCCPIGLMTLETQRGRAGTQFLSTYSKAKKILEQIWTMSLPSSFYFGSQKNKSAVSNEELLISLRRYPEVVRLCTYEEKPEHHCLLGLRTISELFIYHVQITFKM